ncbi:MAG: oligoendopeptidase F [Lachnospiraceae bacterium]|nr:oligoendopeptidase F [Lachnospiraceae bacterium]
MKREEIPQQYKWKMEDLYASNEAWEADFEKLQRGIEDIKKYEGTLAESAENLRKMMENCDALNELAEKVYVYASQRMHEDTGYAYYQGLSGRAQMLLVQLSEATSYIEPEILNIPEEQLAEMMKTEGLQKYEMYFRRLLRRKEHILSKEMEELLAGVDEVAEGPKDTFMMFNNADIKFPVITGEDGEPEEITHGKYIKLLESQNREVRKAAFMGLYETYGKFKNTLGATYRANVKQAGFFAKARKYKSSLEAALSGSAIPVEVYDSLIESVHGHLPALHEYVKVRKEKLGVEELHMYDLYVPMVGEADKKIPYEEAKEIVLAGLTPLGEDYQELLKKGFNEGWIDVYENEGKRSGAYSWGAYGTHPYVLMNYQDTLNNVFTLAHEMGHALHSYHSDEAQDYIYAGYKIFVAEVASTCNEALLIRYLLDHSKDDKEKAYLLNYFLEQFRGTLFRQTMFAEFEKIAHAKSEAGEPLTAEVLCDIYYDLNKQYFGDDIVVDQEIALEWSRIPHFYTPFYVYQYSTGFSAAIAISSKILKGEPGIVEKYKKFLSGGSSLDCIDLLKICDVDMTTKEPVEEALKVFENTLKEFSEII